MSFIWQLLTGGFLKGKRTELAGIGMFALGLAQWLGGDITLATLGDHAATMLGGLGVVGARGVIGELVKAVQALQSAGVGKPPAEPPAS